MKKVNFIFYLMTLSFLFIQCSHDSLLNSELGNEENMLERIYYSNNQEEFNYEVTKKDAILIAQNFFNLESENNGKSITNKKLKKVNKLIDSSTKEVFIYVIQYEKGFCLVSADSRVDPILAYSNSSYWDESTTSAPNVLLKAYKDKIKVIKSKKTKQPTDLKAIWKKLANEKKVYKESSKNKKLKDINDCDCSPESYCSNYYSWSTGQDGFVHDVAQWSQWGSFNYYSPSDSGCDCDKKDAGCGPIALGMLMRYHQSPLMNMSYNGETAFTDYENMPLHRLNTCGSISGGTKSSAMLVRLSGSAMNSMYGPLGNCATATRTSNIGDGLNWFGYTHDGKGDLSDRKNAIISDLKNRYPVIISGAETILGAGWHIWLADGYKEYSSKNWINNETCDDLYKGNDPYLCGVCPECVTCFSYSSQMWHMNWGNGGGSNGWYNISSISIGKYDRLMKAYTNIRPN